MSSKAKKMSERIPVPAQTKTIVFRFEVKAEGIEGTKTSFIAIDNVPIDLPEQFKQTVANQAIKQFESNLNVMRFVRLAKLGIEFKDFVSKSQLYNIDKINALEIVSVKEEKLKEDILEGKETH